MSYNKNITNKMIKLYENLEYTCTVNVRKIILTSIDFVIIEISNLEVKKTK